MILIYPGSFVCPVCLYWVTLLQYGYLLPRHPLDYNSVWDCTDCDNSQANEVIEHKLGKFEEQIEALEKDKVRFKV